MPQQPVRLGRPKGNRDTRERCLAAAEKLFAARGFTGTSLKDVCQKVGVTNASIIHYFGTKQKLYSCVLDRIADSARTILPAQLSEDPEPKAVVRAVDRYVDWAFVHMHYAQLLLRELIENQERVAAARRLHMRPVISAYSDWIQEGQRQGKLADFDAEMFVYYFMGAVTHFCAASRTIERMLEETSSVATLERFRRTLGQSVLAMVSR